MGVARIKPCRGGGEVREKKDEGRGVGQKGDGRGESGTDTPGGCASWILLCCKVTSTGIFLCNIENVRNSHRVQWQLNRSYCFTCTPCRVAAQFD